MDLRAGSTPKSYGAAASGYDVSAQARRSLERLETRYPLRRVAEWPIEALGVHCAVFAITTAELRDTLLARLRADPEVESAQALQTFSVRTDQQQPTPSTTIPMSDCSPLSPRWTSPARIAARAARRCGSRSSIPGSMPVIPSSLAGSRSTSISSTIPTRLPSKPMARRWPVSSRLTANNGEGIVGVAPSAQLLVLRACWQDDCAEGGDAATCNSFTLARALAHAIEDRAAVINLSLAGPDDALLARLLGSAIDRGAIVVGATVEDPASTGRFPGRRTGRDRGELRRVARRGLRRLRTGPRRADVTAARSL